MMMRRCAGLLLLVLVSAMRLGAQQPEIAQDWTESPIKPEISGFVRVANNNTSPSRVLVRLETPTGSRLQETLTGRLGEFSFPQIACGNYVLAVDAAGYQPVRVPVEHSYIPLGAVFLRLVPAGPEGAAAPAATAANQVSVPKAAQSEYEKGIEALTKKHPADSVAHFRKAIATYPEYESAYLQLGWAQIQLRAYPDANKTLEQALHLNSKSAAAYALLGKIQKDQNRLAEALPPYENSVRLEEASWRTQLELGEVLIKLGRVGQAYPHLQRAHELSPTQPATHLQFYNCLILRNDYAAAKAELDEFLKLFPDHALAPRVRQQRDNLQAKLRTTAKQ
ncbi:MAG TPA: tetratricopeptide repeat protein [Candidatus Acidoferrales bacterium]|nr:tetratricopeptide repeat protein [Candidatus Acidoferrales bacterium]